MISKIRKFIAEVMVELKKVSWSTKQELIDSTWIVIISSAVLGIFIAGTDVGLSWIIDKLIY